MEERKPAGVSSEDGFTLIELLVAITVLGVLMSMLYAGMRLGTSAWQRSGAENNAAIDIALVQGTLRDTIERAYPYYDTSDPRGPQVAFAGSETGMTFLASAPHAIDSGDRLVMTVEKVVSTDGLQLVVSGRHELALNKDENGVREVLLGQLSDVQFSYFGAENPTDSPTWHDRWRARRALPELIRIRASFVRTDNRRLWPEFIAAPKVSADVGCVFDVNIKSCTGR